MSQTPPTAELVRAYARKFDTHHLAESNVVSSLGVWLLLALVGPAATRTHRDAIEAALGTSVDDALGRAAELLADPHPAVAAALAVWHRPEMVNDLFDTWAADTWFVTAERGPMPDQPGADAWASARTLDLIKTFPLHIDDATAIVLASALATVGNWTVPFTDLDAEELGGPFAAVLGTASALLAPADHAKLLVHTEAAGIVAAHGTTTKDGLFVVSVIADPSVENDRVLAAAHEAGLFLLTGDGQASRVDLFQLPLGAGHAWELSERSYEARFGPSQVEHYSAQLAPWSLSTLVDLSSSPGVNAALATMQSMLTPEAAVGSSSEARQSAMAEFSKTGFKAAAVSGFAQRAGAAPSEPKTVVERHATLRFNRPHAAVALTMATPWLARQGITASPIWHTIPVFEAWVDLNRAV